MEKTFILLRDHKQQGPYTLAQMAALYLKPDELVYVENNVAGWRAAEEIDVLKPYISLAAIQKETGLQVPEIKVSPVQEIKPEPIVKAEVSNSKIRTSSPEAKRSAERIAHQPLQQAVNSKENIEVRTEKEAVENTRSLAHNYKQPVSNVITVVPVAKQPAFENTTPHYSGAPIKKIKKEKRASNKAMLVAAVALAVFAFGFILNFLIGDKSLPDKTTAVQSGVEQSNTTETKASIEAALPKADPENEKLAVTPVATATKEEEIEVPAVEPETEIQVADTEPENSVATLQPVKTTSLAPVREEKNKSPEPTPSELTIQDQIAVQSTAIENGAESGIYGLNISLQNKSEKALKMVAVNVFYTDDEGAIINKQTLYFSDVQPGQAVSRAASGHKVATKAYCKVGLVSSEGKIYYEN